MEQLHFSVKGKNYVTEELRVGKLVDLWKMRNALSMGSYGQIYRMGLANADDALLVIDIEAFFTVFCPDFMKALRPSSIRDLGIEDYCELRDLYVSQIQPWMEKVEAVLKKKSENE